MKSVFVTVGTTKFTELVIKLSSKELLDAFKELGVNFVQIQSGKQDINTLIHSDIPEKCIIKNNNSIIVNIDDQLTLKYDPYFENFTKEISKADLVISHAGAGSCLDVLRLNKPLIVVINENLMDNHQQELAEQLQENGHLFYCICDNLIDTMKMDFSKLKKYPTANKYIFANYFDNCCGFFE